MCDPVGLMLLEVIENNSAAFYTIEDQINYMHPYMS